ncbi:hypothetical protein CIL03_04980 [Virgibacillus indicus]|uniref:Sporulation protein n=1 Tax=Virgibacillus indicus TaxID=2024554 RepID=A0A265NGE9_9BACI|nr:hypothetical protein [Virgibacillus indicus]OZU90504.1 hypothetical protein CIL03_04980 [Virgibacillus indicus]
MKYKIVLSVCLVLLLIGCGKDSVLEPTNDKNTDIELKMIKANTGMDQHISNQAKELLSSYDAITSVKAVNDEKNLLTAIEVHHNKRFNLKKIQKELTKELEKKFKNFHVELTLDKKLVLELDKLEKAMESGDISKKKLKKEIKKLTKLSKEQA